METLSMGIVAVIITATTVYYCQKLMRNNRDLRRLVNLQDIRATITRMQHNQ